MREAGGGGGGGGGRIPSTGTQVHHVESIVLSTGNDEGKPQLFSDPCNEAPFVGRYNNAVVGCTKSMVWSAQTISSVV